MAADTYIVSRSNEALRDPKVLVLTGAGASAPYGMPPTNKFHERCESSMAQKLQRICRYFRESDIDLEFVLERLDLCQKKIAPDLQSGGFLNAVLGVDKATHLESECNLLRSYIYRRIIEIYGELTDDQAEQAIELYGELFARLRGLNGQGRPTLPIFTTNYDLTFENISDRDPKLRFVTGMRSRFGGSVSCWDPTVYEDEPLAPFAVFRLHGCSHWFEREADGGIWFQRFVHTGPEVEEAPKILYPEPGKDKQVEEEPFATAYRYFRDCLRAAKTVVIIGYSGRDAVIQDYLTNALQADRKKNLVVVTGGTELRPELKRITVLAEAVTHIGGGIEGNTDKVWKAVTGQKEIAVADSMRMSDSAKGG